MPTTSDLLDLARRERGEADEAYGRRKRALRLLQEQVQAGVWQSEKVKALIAQGRRDGALLRVNRWDFVEANGGGYDLDIDYNPLLRSPRRLKEAAIHGAEGFLEKVRPFDDEIETWLQALKCEAQAYLAQMTGDRLLSQVLDRADKIVADLLAPVAHLDPGNDDTLSAYVEGLRTYTVLRLPWRVVALYRRLLSRIPEPDPPGDLLACLMTDYQSVDRGRLWTWQHIADLVAPVLELRNPSDRTELETMLRLQTPLEAAIAGGPVERPTIDAGDVDRDTFVRSRGSLKAILRVLPQDSRPAAVLAAWQGLAMLGLRDFAGISSLLSPLEADDEALGIVIRALRGEACYRLGQYEDAYLDLLRAEARGVAALARRGGDQKAWTHAERDGLARLAQKAGNALLAIGDERKADEAFTRAKSWLPDDPLSQAIDLINRGNLAFLRNSLTGEQGYMIVDRVLQKRLIDEGPRVLQAEKMSRHTLSLSQAEQCYWDALELIPAGECPSDLAAVCHLNLGNIAWAWADALSVEGAARLAELALEDGFVSQLVKAAFDGTGCLAAAIGEYEKVVQLTRSARSAEARLLAAAALGNLSEVRFLRARAGDLRQLHRALREAESALIKLRERRPTTGNASGAGADTTRSIQILHPELQWRATFNLARIRQALGDLTGAEAAYGEAITQVEALRVGLRLDAWQALFLHDKLEVYEGAISFLFDQDSVAHAAEIFELIERTKARAFLDLLAAAKVDVGLPPDLKQRCDVVLGQVAACNEAIRAATLADDQSRTRRLLRDQQRYALQWADLQTEIAEEQEADAQLRPPLVGLSEVQAALGPDRVLLTYLLGAQASYLVAVSQAQARVFRLPPRKVLELATLPVLYTSAWSDLNYASSFRQANAVLTGHLLAPLDALGGVQRFLRDKHVLIVPDGVLCYLPFELFLADITGAAALAVDASYQDLAPHYLIQFADVSYAPSASAWRELSNRLPQMSAASLLAVYDLRYDTGDEQPPAWALPILMNLANVPGAPDVKKAIEQARLAWPSQPVVQMRAHGDDGQLEDAAWQPTEENFLRIASSAGARFVIFNGHAIYNDKHPSLSGLVFNLKPAAEPDAADIPSDSFLRVDELFRLELPGAELTFLAACQTALGAPYRGEGLNALQRAFMYRGSPAVVATLWAVDANAASWLVRRFFKLLAEQPEADPARLFSQAKRKSIGFDGRWLPFHWAPFIYSGGTRWTR